MTSSSIVRKFHHRCGLKKAALKTHALQTLARLPLVFVVLAISLTPIAALDLKNAVVVSSPDFSPPEKKAVTMLIEEVEKRTHVIWPATASWPSSNAPVILVGNKSALTQFAGPHMKELRSLRSVSGAEGFQLSVKSGQNNPIVFVIGNDARGVLFGVGRFCASFLCREAA